MMQCLHTKGGSTWAAAHLEGCKMLLSICQGCSSALRSECVEKGQPMQLKLKATRLAVLSKLPSVLFGPFQCWLEVMLLDLEASWISLSTVTAMLFKKCIVTCTRDVHDCLARSGRAYTHAILHPAALHRAPSAVELCSCLACLLLLTGCRQACHSLLNILL
jgi:hypothetical protein